MHQMVQTIRRIAQHEAARSLPAALGVVTSLHTDGGAPDYACTVQLRETGIVLPKVPIATGLIGAVAPPAEGDLVLVVFLSGDLQGPVVVSRLYDDQVRPPASDPGQVVVRLPHAETSDDASILLDVATPDDGSRSVTLTLGGSVEVKVTVDAEQVELRAGEALLRLRQTGGSDGKAELQVGGSSVVIEQGGNVTITAEGTLELKANQVKISGDSSVKVVGQTIDLN